MLLTPDQIESVVCRRPSFPKRKQLPELQTSETIHVPNTWTKILF